MNPLRQKNFGEMRQGAHPFILAFNLNRGIRFEFVSRFFGPRQIQTTILFRKQVSATSVKAMIVNPVGASFTLPFLF